MQVFIQQPGAGVRSQPILRAGLAVETDDHDKAQAGADRADHIGRQKTGKARVCLNGPDHPVLIVLAMISVNIMDDHAGAMVVGR